MTGDTQPTIEHYFTARPNAADTERTVEFTVAGREYALRASGGVFSTDRLDPGTAVLLRKAPPPGPRGGVFLDLGCGYGPVASVLAGTSPKALVYAVDINERALELARGNATRLGLASQMRVMTPDDVPPDVVFDEIWSNPPIRIGKAALHAMLTRWLPRLAPGGTAWLVVARNLGADSLHRWLAEQGWPIVRHASQQGYRVLRVTRTPERIDHNGG